MNQPNKTRWIFIAIAALAAASAAFFVFGASKPEPLYQGRPLSFWIEQMGGGRVPGVFVPPNVEAWKAFLLDKNRNSAALIVTLTGLLREPDAPDRWRAIELLRKAGPEVAVVVPALVERLKDENNRVRGLAAIVLGEVGPAAQLAVPAVREALKDEYSNVREAAAEALKKIAPAERQ